MGKVSDFFTGELSNEGVKLPLINPTTGKGEWIKIRGIDSDIFRAANLIYLRSALKIAELETDKERKEAAKMARLELLTSLVVAWSFDSICNHDEIINVLKNAPMITNLVDEKASTRSLFLQKKSKVSKTTPKRNSNSRRSRKVQK